jgi:hypothetical protein
MDASGRRIRAGMNVQAVGEGGPIIGWEVKLLSDLSDRAVGDVNMPVQMICPNLRCRKILSVPEEVRGKLVKCQFCQTNFRVPEAKKPVATAGGERRQ